MHPRHNGQRHVAHPRWPGFEMVVGGVCLGHLTVGVALSERNLLTLLSNLYTPGSPATIYVSSAGSVARPPRRNR